MTAARPNVLVFDVNETLIDIESLAPLFGRLFGDPRVLREWFGQLVMYSMAITLSGLHEDFFALGAGALEMLGTIRGVTVKAEDMASLEAAMQTMPPYEDVRAGLERLRDGGFRLVTLTNSPPSPTGQSPLERAGLADVFERRFSVAAVRAFKPSPAVYRLVTDELGVAPSSCCMVAAHVWDTIGAQSAGMSGALITRPGNAPLKTPGLPQPDWIAPDLRALAEQMTRC